MTMSETRERPKHDRKAVEAVIAALAANFGNRLVTSSAVREQHGNTLTWIGNQPPDAVIFPQTTEDVQKIVGICAAERVPVIAFGTGTSLEGQVNAPRGGVCLDFRDMNRVLAVHAEDLDCVVQPGITRKQLNEHLRDKGVFFPIDPGADASLGGMASTRASGTNAVRYGTMKDNVLALKVVLANGEVMSTARRAKKTSSGYDLTRLIVGAEGTLGIITELTLAPRRHSGSDRVRHLSISLGGGGLQRHDPDHSIRHSGRAHRASRYLAGAGIERSIRSSRCRRRRCCSSNFTAARRASPNRRSVSARSPRNSAAVRSSARRRRRSARGCGRRATMPIGRKSACGRAPMRSRPTSACRSRGWPNASPQTQRDIAANNLVAPIVGHVGDGNFHVGLLVDLDDKDEVARVNAFLDRLVERALAMDGTCTGEHGIGQGKMKYLLAEHGEPALDAMRAIKRVLDPLDIINPGKIVSR